MPERQAERPLCDSDLGRRSIVAREHRLGEAAGGHRVGPCEIEGLLRLGSRGDGPARRYDRTVPCTPMIASSRDAPSLRDAAMRPATNGAANDVPDHTAPPRYVAGT